MPHIKCDLKLPEIVKNVTTGQNFLSDKIIFGEVISRRTAYGLIWEGKYDNKPCVIKMIMLTTGIHYDKNYNVYRDGMNQKLIYEYADYYFSENDEKPFYHTDFRHRRSMTPNNFFYEVDQIIALSKIDLAPSVYGYGICNESYEIHYGFLVMEKVDCSLKDIYMNRLLDETEIMIVNGTIDHLHNKYGIIHGDMKPSNIGAYLDHNGRIIKCCFFDCQKIKHRSDYDENKFQQLVKKDWNIYNKHIIKNREKKSN